MRFDDPYSLSVQLEYWNALQAADAALARRVQTASAADLNRLYRLIFGGAAGPAGSQRRLDWTVVNAWAAQTFPKYMAGRRIGRTVTRQLLSPHTAVGRKRLRKNFENARRDAKRR